MLVAVICIAAVFGAFIAVLLKRLSEGKNVQALVDDGDPNHPDTTVIYAIEPDSTAVKTLYQVFSWGREAMAEYLYYGEIDSAALQDDGTGNLDGTRFYAEVSVSFEADALKAEQQNLQNYRRAGLKCHASPWILSWAMRTSAVWFHRTLSPARHARVMPAC